MPIEAIAEVGILLNGGHGVTSINRINCGPRWATSVPVSIQSVTSQADQRLRVQRIGRGFDFGGLANVIVRPAFLLRIDDRKMI